MGFRFRRSVRLAKGLRLNFGKDGVSSITAGGRGFSVTAGRKGVRRSVGLPGTGLSHSSYQPYTDAPAGVPSAPRPPQTFGTFIATLVVLGVLFLLLKAAWWVIGIPQRRFLREQWDEQSSLCQQLKTPDTCPKGPRP